MSEVLFGMRPQRPAAGTVPAHPPVFVSSALVTAGGTATIRLPAVPAGQVWILERVNISANSAATPTLVMYDRDPNAPGVNFLDGSTAGNGDVDDSASVVLYPDNQLTLVWAGATPGATCRCRVQYRIEAAG